MLAYCDDAGQLCADCIRESMPDYSGYYLPATVEETKGIIANSTGTVQIEFQRVPPRRNATVKTSEWAKYALYHCTLRVEAGSHHVQYLI